MRALARERSRRYRLRHPRPQHAGFGETRAPTQFLRCPVCGRLDVGAGLANAGRHRLDAATPESQGARGFRWSFQPMTAEHREALAILLRRALAQLEDRRTEMMVEMRTLEPVVSEVIERVCDGGIAPDMGITRESYAINVVDRSLPC